MLRDIRKQYNFSRLSEDNVNELPYEQLSFWLKDAVESNELEPTAMVISTVDNNLHPHSRIVLLKDLSDDGLVFFTNYQSNKAMQIEANSKVHVLFFWKEQERQVRITGVVGKTDIETTIEYFKTRPIDSQIGAWASPQSKIIPNMEYLENSFDFYQNKFGSDIPTPEHWGGYLIQAESFEFWQGRPNRLHDRIFYSKNDDGKWQIVRLAP